MIEDLESDIKFKNNKWEIIDPRYKSVTICASKQKVQFEKILNTYNIKLNKNMITIKGRKTIAAKNNQTDDKNIYRKKVCKIIEKNFKENGRIFYLM